MLRFERCNVKACVDELLALGNNNARMWNLFNWLAEHDELQHGTQAEIIKLYVEDELAGYSLLESYQARTDKIVLHEGITYQELGVVHFRTLKPHRNKGYATLLAAAMYDDIVEPMLAQYRNVHAYVIATGRAAPLMARTDISPLHLIQQFYSEASFEEKVVNYLKVQAQALS
ncbi:conserved hypothetical protein [Oleispira antarctica RB-8]|uniref:N-acetyltransferase domain-containing protein n=1 Tax=Oleispira antarctica RB-8 TaxID=698738 RepID=R4YJW7_OLEAN|nr:conserved hypothetical protein [Oleispira antarctica RB-8]